MASLQVPQEEYPLRVASGGNCRRSSPNSTRQGYFAELARGLSHPSLVHKNPIKVPVVTEAGRTDAARLSGFDAPAVPVRLRDRPGRTTPGQAHYEIWSEQPSLEVTKQLHCRERDLGEQETSVWNGYYACT